MSNGDWVERESGGFKCINCSTVVLPFEEKACKCDKPRGYRTSTTKLRCMDEQLRTINSSHARMSNLYRAETQDCTDLLQEQLLQMRQLIMGIQNTINNRLQERSDNGEDTF